MNEGHQPSEHEQELRRQAERKLRALDPDALGEKSLPEIRQLVHELQVHQVELEMQQDELQSTAHALRASEARYRRLYQFAPNGYFTLNARGNIEELNFAAAALLGLDRRLAVGKLLRTFVQVNSRDDFDGFFRNLQYLQDPQRCEVTLLPYAGEPRTPYAGEPRTPYAGEPRTVLLEGAGLGEEPAGSIHFLVTAVDITERYRAEAAAREQNNLLQSVMSAVLTGLLVLDCVRDERGEVTDFAYRLANPFIEQLTGRSLTGGRLLQLYPGLRGAGILDRLKAVVDTGRPADFEQYYGGEGFNHWFRITAVKLGDGVVSSIEDITDRKRLEEANLRMRLEGQQELLHAIMEAQEEERRRISESLHNGVGQILYATKLNLARLELDKTPLPLEQLRQAKARTDQLLTEAIRETRNVSHELIPIMLQERGLAVAMADFCKRFSHTGIQLSCHGLEERLDRHLENAIFRIAQELVNNMVKHAEATRGRIEVLREGDRVVIEAQDNGRGIDPVQPGKGIGLRTIRDRVTLLQGTLEIDSAPGAGTMVTVTLPMLRKGG
jgi:PAS domain S-box-containing protein